MFVKGRNYVRRELHNQYGGQQQGGISTPRQHPIILIFTGEQGEDYGYRDDWTSERVFCYTGEGQQGDMEFVRGNRAIREHIQLGKDLHLFQYVGLGIVKYVDQLICSGYEFREAHDVDGNPRRAIVFHLVSIDAFGEQDIDTISDDQRGLTLVELRQRALSMDQSPSEPSVSLTTTRARSAAVRDYVLMRAEGICEACGIEAPFHTENNRPYLETHHIRRLSDGGPDHPEWVAGVCPNCHRRAHFANDREGFNNGLQEIVADKERNLGNLGQNTSYLTMNTG